MNTRGILRERLGDHRAAIADYDEALRRDERSAAALANRGVARAELGDLAGGADDLRRALALGDDQPGLAWSNLGTILQMAGDDAVAVDALTRALEVDPSQPVALANRGLSRLRLGDARGAADDCALALRALPRGSDKAAEAERCLREAWAALGER